MAGKFSTEDGADDPNYCTDCDSGRYSGTEGADSEAFCLLCEAGTYSTEKGATSNDTCTLCAAGTYSESEGAASADDCILCPQNYYSAELGATDNSTCTPCEMGTFTKDPGASDPTMCRAPKDDDDDDGVLLGYSATEVGGAGAGVFVIICLVGLGVFFLRRGKSKPTRKSTKPTKQDGAVPMPFNTSTTQEGGQGQEDYADEEEEEEDEVLTPNSGMPLAHLNAEPPSDLDTEAPPPPDHAPRDINLV